MRFEKLLLAAAALCLVCMTPACSDDDPATDPEQNETPGTPGEGEGDGDDDSGEPGEPDTPDTPALTEGVRAEGYYKGDYHDEGTGNYWINFTVEDENDPGGYYILCLDFGRNRGGRPRFRGAGRQRLSYECREWLSGRNAQRRRRHLSGAPRRRGRFHLFRGAERFGQGRDDRGPL